MSKVCKKCGRGTTTGNSRSHSNIATRRTFKINLQSKSLNGKKEKICTKCLKTMVKSK